MNKIFNLILGAMTAACVASCSSSEEITPSGTPTGDLVVHVTTDYGPAGSRASVPQIPGYTLKCVMQLFADDGVAVGTREVINISTGSSDFVLHAKDIADGATRAAFWAEYMPDDPLNTPKIYNSDDLSNITYSETSFDLTDANRMAAMEAFAGVLTSFTDKATVTLRRPMVKLNFTPRNTENVAGSRMLSVSYEAPAGYNVVESTCSKEAYTELTYTNDTFDTEATPWFSNMIFAPSNLSTLDRPISMVLSGRGDKVLTIAENTIPLDANYIINAAAEISKAPTQDLNVEVTIDDQFTNDPDRVIEMVVGSYVNAKGRATLDPTAAVGIVFYMGAMSGDNISLYPEQFADKKIKGYAVALENTSTGRLKVNSEIIPAGFPAAETLVNGMQNSATILAGLGDSPFAAAWNQWVANHPFDESAADIVTGWYIPARAQMEEWISMLMPTTNLRNEMIAGSPTGSREFRALFPLNTIFDRDPFKDVMFMTCSVNKSGTIQGTNVAATENGTNGSVRFSQLDIVTKTPEALGRPMITIFE